MKWKAGSGKKAAYLGLLCAAGILLGYVETLIPFFFGIPGMKLGLPNLAVVMVLYLYSWREALAVSLVRILVIGFLFGNVFSISFSMSGGLISLLSMALVKRSGKLDVIGVSMTGGVAHNAGQILVAMAVTENILVGYIFFPLVLSGLITGMLIGILGGELVKRMRRAVPELGDNGKCVTAQVNSQDDVSKQAHISRKRDNASMN